MLDSKPAVIAVPVAKDRARSGFYALGLLVAYAKLGEGGRLQEYFDFPPIRLLSGEDVDVFLDRLDPCRKSIYLFSSFVWNHQINIDVSKRIRKISPESLIIFGGANIPRSEKDSKIFMAENSHIDILVFGEGEETLFFILDKISKYYAIHGHFYGIDFSGVRGLIYRKDFEYFYTGLRDLMRDINVVPSPYLNAIYDDSIFSVPSVVVETNRGCPFGCTFCDWGGQILSKVRKFDMDRVKLEMTWLAKSGVERITVCDANFGMLQRDVDITEHVIDLNRTIGFPRQFRPCMAKNSARRVNEIAVKLIRSGLQSYMVVSFQTLDRETLKNIDRDNIKLSDYEDILCNFRKHDIPMFTELLIGLPGQTIESFKRDLQKSFDWQVTPLVYPVMVMVNAPMSDEAYRKKYTIRVDDNGYVISTSSFSEKDRQYMLDMRMISVCLIQQKLAKYMLLYFQMDHGIKAMELIARLMDRLHFYENEFPELFWFIKSIRSSISSYSKDWLMAAWSHEIGDRMCRNMKKIFNELFDFVEVEFSVSVNFCDRESLVDLQLALNQMRGRRFPESIKVHHDVIAYIKQFSGVVSLDDFSVAFRKLADFPNGLIHVPPQKVRKRLGFFQTDLELSNWPLRIQGLDD